jgi:hypothetical protein
MVARPPEPAATTPVTVRQEEAVLGHSKLMADFLKR